MKRYIVALVAIALCMGARAQETLTLQQCLDLAVQNNKQIAASQEQTRQYMYTQKSTYGYFFPDIYASGNGLYSSIKGSYDVESAALPVVAYDEAGNMTPLGTYAYFPGMSLNYNARSLYQAGINVDQPLFMGGKLTAAYRMSKLGYSMAQLNEAIVSNDVMLETSRAYADVVKAASLRQVALSYCELLKELEKNVENAKKHGLKANNDVLKVRVKLNQGELNVKKAENALRLAKMNLCRLIGKPLDADIAVSDDLPQVEKVALQAADVSGRPEYSVLSQKVQMAREQVKLQRAEILPQVGVRGSYNYYYGLKLNDKTLLNRGGFAVLLNVRVPIYHFGERIHKINAAKAQLVQAEMEQADLTDKMTLELTQAMNNLEEAKIETDIAGRSLEQAEENMRLSKKRYEVGLETLSDYLEAQALWQEAYQTKIDARFSAYITYLNYLKAVGMPLAHDAES